MLALQPLSRQVYAAEGNKDKRGCQLRKDDIEYLLLLANELKEAYRFGESPCHNCEPEGLQYIKMSDELATNIAESLTNIAGGYQDTCQVEEI